MIKKLLMVGMLMTFLTATTAVFAEEVFITQKGTKYHKEICRLLKSKENVSKMEKKEAVAEDYEPCRRCFKEDVAGESK